MSEADHAPRGALPPVRSAQIAEGTQSTAMALSRKAAQDAQSTSSPPVGERGTRPVKTAPSAPGPAIDEGAAELIAAHDAVARQPRRPAIPEGEMTLEQLANYAGTTVTDTPAPDDVADDSAGWNAGEFLRGRVPQVQRTGASLAAATVAAMNKKNPV
jgi:hypothetical protein